MNALTPVQAGRFIEQGWLKLDGLPDARAVAAADACAARLEARVHFNERGWGQVHASNPEFMALMSAPVRALLESALGSPVSGLGVRLFPVAGGNDNAQIAYMRRCAGECAGYNEHVDGAPNPGQHHLNKHSAMIAVALTPVRAERCGNYTVWPGSHRHVSTYLNDSGAGSSGVQAIWNAVTAPPGCAPLQVIAEPGDVFLIHHLLLHGTACNQTDQVRRMVFFRVNFRFYAETDVAAFADLWGDWRGLTNRSARPAADA